MPLPLLPVIAGGLATSFAFLTKHPIVTKMLIFSTFVGFLTFAIGFIKDFVSPYIVTNSFMAVASYFGLLDGLSLYITIVVAGWGMKQVLAFVRA
ncbi:MAG: hypothetical protein K0B07_05795 [DPANN group archaeon]|nr:hypothetical protein [DPANN group archaeon]